MGLALPNFENPGEPIESWRTSQSRGTRVRRRSWLRAYHAAPMMSSGGRRECRLLHGFRLPFFNGAPEDQIYPGYLRGGELVRTVILTGGEDVFELPSLRVRFSAGPPENP